MGPVSFAFLTDIPPEIGAAIVAGVITVAVAVWQTRRTLTHQGTLSRAAAREQATLSRDASTEQAKLSASTTLLPLRHHAYAELWNLLDVGPKEKPANLETAAERDRLAAALTSWYYPHGLLLSDGSQKQWRVCRDALRTEGLLNGPAQAQVHDQISLLRSWLKADMMLRTIDEVSVAARDIRNRGTAEERPTG